MLCRCHAMLSIAKKWEQNHHGKKNIFIWWHLKRELLPLSGMTAWWNLATKTSSVSICAKSNGYFDNCLRALTSGFTFVLFMDLPLLPTNNKTSESVFSTLLFNDWFRHWDPHVEQHFSPVLESELTCYIFLCQNLHSLISELVEYYVATCNFWKKKTA